MAKCEGRSYDITLMPGKPIGEGFKVWIAAYHGYVFAFELYSRRASSERSKEKRPSIPESMWLEAFKVTHPDRTPPPRPSQGRLLAESQALIYRFAGDLPRGHSWVLYLDNLFINQPLLALLRKNLGVGAMGTTRSNALGIPFELLRARDQKYQWGSTVPTIVGEVLIAM
jgi:hypothetical protein